MTERENGWYLRSDGYMTSECSYQRIEAMKGNRALDNHQKLVFVKYMGGEEKDSRVYVPEQRVSELESLVRDIWTFYHMPTPYTPKEIAIRMTVEESLIERVAALGLSGGDAE